MTIVSIGSSVTTTSSSLGVTIVFESFGVAKTGEDIARMAKIVAIRDKAILLIRLTITILL